MRPSVLHTTTPWASSDMRAARRFFSSSTSSCAFLILSATASCISWWRSAKLFTASASARSSGVPAGCTRRPGFGPNMMSASSTRARAAITYLRRSSSTSTPSASTMRRPSMASMTPLRAAIEPTASRSAGDRAAVFYAALSPADREAVGSIAARKGVILAMLGLLMVLALGVLVELLLRRYVIAARALVEEADIMLGPNPGRRVHPAGTPELRALAEAVNSFAERHQEMQEAVADKIKKAQANVEEEKNRLAALMSELAQGVVVCNTEGRILLYNSR